MANLGEIAALKGGIIYLPDHPSSFYGVTLTVTNCDFSNNIYSETGGFIYDESI